MLLGTLRQLSAPYGTEVLKTEDGMFEFRPHPAR